MQSIIAKVLLIIGGIFGTVVATSTMQTDVINKNVADGVVLGASTTAISAAGKVYTQAQLLTMASSKMTTLTLGDNKYVTGAPKQGYVYLCHVNKDSNQGAGTDGPWISGTTWLPQQKVSVDGNLSWSNATFKNIISGAKRLLTGNNLPIDHTTGNFPIDKNSTAGQYDRNPNSIKTQNLSYSISANPIYSSTPTCEGGEVGIMLSGVPIFNGFDAKVRDAQAHEVQDNCSGHPQEKGEYHYHGLSNCFKNIFVTNVLGFALDGFPITGPQVAEGKYLHTKDLDVCHGINSQIILDGKKINIYHYVMTEDFPYSVSCFRGTPIQMGGQTPTSPSLPPDRRGIRQAGQTPPQPALDACSGKQSGSSCTVTTPNGNFSGSCKYTPDQKYFACIPNNR